MAWITISRSSSNTNACQPMQLHRVNIVIRNRGGAADARALLEVEQRLSVEFSRVRHGDDVDVAGGVVVEVPDLDVALTRHGQDGGAYLVLGLI